MSLLLHSNFLRTDGVALEFIFRKPLPPTTDFKTPASFENWIRYGAHRTTIWGVDPGLTDVFVAADGDNEDRHRFRKTSATEYYDLCGYNIATNRRRRWREAEQPQWRELLDNMPSLKTSNFANLVDAINYRLSNFWAVVNHYDRDFRYRVLALKLYKGQ